VQILLASLSLLGAACIFAIPMSILLWTNRKQTNGHEVVLREPIVLMNPGTLMLWNE